MTSGHGLVDVGLVEVGDGFLGAEREVILTTASRLSRLATVDPASVSREHLAEMVVELAAAAESTAVMAGRFMGQGELLAASLTKGEKSMVALVSSGSRISRCRAQQLKRAGMISHRFPHFHAALMDGKITTGHTDVLVAAAKLADSHQFAAAERALAALAVLCSPEEFRDKMKEWVAAADPTEHLDRFLAEQARRHFVYGKDVFGNIHFSGTFEPVSGEQMIDSIENRKAALAAKGGAKTSAGTVDALVDLVLGDSNGAANLEIICPEPIAEDLQIHDEAPPFSGPMGVHAESYADATAADATPADAAAEEADRLRCAEIEALAHWHDYMKGDRTRFCPPVPILGDTGFASMIYPRTVGGTLIPPQIAARLARKGRMRRHMIDRDGNLCADTAGGRRFSAGQKRMIRLRDGHCQHPGCRTPARQSDLDHIQDLQNDGPTIVNNGQLLCEFHHRWKHRHDSGPHRPVQFDDSPVTIQRE